MSLWLSQQQSELQIRRVYCRMQQSELRIENCLKRIGKINRA